MKAHKYWSVGALITMLGTFYTGYKKQKSSHKYFALSSMLCMVMAIYTGHKMITGNRKEKAKKEKVTDTSAYQSVIIDPKKFEDCKKIANYIKDDKTVTLNLEHLDNETAQRIIDFLSGAMSIKEAKLIEISKNVYVSVPKNINVFFDGEEDRKEKSFLKL